MFFLRAGGVTIRAEVAGGAQTTQARMPVLLNLRFFERRDDFSPACQKRRSAALVLRQSRAVLLRSRNLRELQSFRATVIQAPVEAIRLPASLSKAFFRIL